MLRCLIYRFLDTQKDRRGKNAVEVTFEEILIKHFSKIDERHRFMDSERHMNSLKDKKGSKQN